LSVSRWSITPFFPHWWLWERICISSFQSLVRTPWIELFKSRNPGIFKWAVGVVFAYFT
jgi:hypothetical protein